MAVYNGKSYVRHAIESILSQTFVDFELILIEDGSTDETPLLLREYDDPRIRLIENGQNIGLTRSLNRGIRAAGGEFIARQDADDYSLPKRLARQVSYLDTHPQVGLVGSGSRWIDQEGNKLHDWQPMTDPVDLHQTLLYSIPFLHGTFMFRRQCLADLDGGYNEAFPVAQDCDLLLRLSDKWDVANYAEILYVHRLHKDTVTANCESEQLRCLEIAQQAAIRRRLAYGWRRLGLSKATAPEWVFAMERRGLAQRYVWWSAAARQHSRGFALQFLIIALLLDPTTSEIWHYIAGIAKRKTRKS